MKQYSFIICGPPALLYAAIQKPLLNGWLEIVMILMVTSHCLFLWGQEGGMKLTLTIPMHVTAKGDIFLSFLL